MSMRAAVWLRCNGYCERCGIPLAADWALHHRKLRSRGGKDEITNYAALHHFCHNGGTNSVHAKPDDATRDGFMVHSWDDPARVPLRLPDNALVLLTPEGTYDYLEKGSSEQF